MSHIFISYCHADIDTLKKLKRKLATGNLLKEIWYDKHIEAGNQWIPQIDTALDEAYALIVIVTPNSMKSSYVIYEWSSMIGSNTPIFPLLFEGEYDDVHPRLKQEQVVDCRRKIPTSLIDSIIATRSTPPEIAYLNWNISEVILRFRIAVLITLWFFERIDYPSRDVMRNMRFLELVRGMLDETVVAYSLKLPELIVSKSHAFNKKQLRMCRELIIGLQTFWQLFNNRWGNTAYHTSASAHNEAPRAIAYWNEYLKARVDFFRVTHHYEDAFNALETALETIRQGKTDMGGNMFLEPTSVIDWLFEKEDKYGKLLQETIQQEIDILIQLAKK